MQAFRGLVFAAALIAAPLPAESQFTDAGRCGAELAGMSLEPIMEYMQSDAEDRDRALVNKGRAARVLPLWSSPNVDKPKR